MWLHLVRDTPVMFRELKVVEQRYRAVLEVRSGLLTGNPVGLGETMQPTDAWPPS
jgi:hypothetical protein